MRILIAEGEQYMSEMLIILLKRTGYTTDVVSDGQSCIEWVETGIYDALIVTRCSRRWMVLPCWTFCVQRIMTYRF